MKAVRDFNAELTDGDEVIVFNRRPIYLPRVNARLADEYLPPRRHKFRVKLVQAPGGCPQCWLVKGGKGKAFGAHINWWQWAIAQPQIKITVRRLY